MVVERLCSIQPRIQASFLLVMPHSPSVMDSKVLVGGGEIGGCVQVIFMGRGRSGIHHIHPCSSGEFYVLSLSQRAWEMQLSICA